MNSNSATVRPLGDWRSSTVASVTTHDLPTALGWLRGEHVRARAELGLLNDPEAEEKAWLGERDELVQLLRDAGLVGAEPTEAELLEALTAAIAHTPAQIVLMAPGDAVGDLRQPNLPGTIDEYPCWRLPVADEEQRPLMLEDLLGDARMSRLAALLRKAVR